MSGGKYAANNDVMLQAQVRPSHPPMDVAYHRHGGGDVDDIALTHQQSEESLYGEVDRRCGRLRWMCSVQRRLPAAQHSTGPHYSLLRLLAYLLDECFPQELLPHELGYASVFFLKLHSWASSVSQSGTDARRPHIEHGGMCRALTYRGRNGSGTLLSGRRPAVSPPVW